MLLSYFKSTPNTFVMKYRHGKLKAKGTGLSFYYYPPSTSIVSIPTQSMEAPFIFNETTRDYQSVTVQGQVVFSISDPEKLATMMNFTLNHKGYVSEDPYKLGDRILNVAQVAIAQSVQQSTLRECLDNAATLIAQFREAFTASPVLQTLGIRVIDLAVQAIRPVPETARALESATREALLLEADRAVYQRRNAAIEQERQIKENELQTEMAVNQRNREIRENLIEADRAVKEKQRVMAQEEMLGSIALEEKRQALVDLSAENDRKESDTQAYRVEQWAKAVNQLDDSIIQAIADTGMAPEKIIANAFRTLANSNNIGQLNITPDLLQSLTSVGAK